jgi:hypothetical protein
MGAIFMFGDGGPVVRSTTEEASAFMEAVDVENGEYDVVYDESGLILRPQVQDRQVHLLPTESVDLSDLIRRLSEWCQTKGVSLDSHSAAFPAQVARRIAESEWRTRWPKRPAWLSRMIHGSTPPRFDT